MEKMNVARAREILLSAALGLASSSFYMDASSDLPGPYDDAQMELKTEMLDMAAAAYVDALNQKEELKDGK